MDAGKQNETYLPEEQALPDTMDIVIDRLEAIACKHCDAMNDVEGMPLFSTATCHACDRPFKVYGLVENFMVTREIGVGGMGCVYEAVDPILYRRVAIKVLNSTYSNNEDFSENLINEARTIASFSHPNIVQLFAFGQIHNEYYIVMEFIDGPSLDELIEAREMLDELDILNIGIDVSKGLQAAHAKYLIHGDIKPENIMIDREFRAKVVDFGLVYAANEIHEGVRLGSPYYISPESIENRREDFRSDLYSLGATLYHALAGEPPFIGETMEEIVDRHLNAPIPALTVIRPDVREETIAIIYRLLAKDPADRYTSHDLLIGDLKKSLVTLKETL